MLNSGKIVRVVAVIFAVGGLLIPGLMPVLAWGLGATRNLEVAILGIVASIALRVWLAKAKWIGATITSLLIAVPPFPYWSRWRQFGFNLDDLPVFTFIIVFLVAMLLFALIFWAIGKRGTGAGSHTAVN